MPRDYSAGYTLRILEALDSVDDALKILRALEPPHDTAQYLFLAFAEESLTAARSKISVVAKQRKRDAARGQQDKT